MRRHKNYCFRARAACKQQLRRSDDLCKSRFCGNTLRDGQNALRDGQNALRDGQIAMRGGQNAMRGGQNAMRGGQNAMRGGQNAMRDGQNALRDGQKKFLHLIACNAKSQKCKIDQNNLSNFLPPPPPMNLSTSILASSTK